jgi:hypothetical protein
MVWHLRCHNDYAPKNKSIKGKRRERGKKKEQPL